MLSNSLLVTTTVAVEIRVTCVLVMHLGLQIYIRPSDLCRIGLPVDDMALGRGGGLCGPWNGESSMPDIYATYRYLRWGDPESVIMLYRVNYPLPLPRRKTIGLMGSWTGIAVGIYFCTICGASKEVRQL